MAHRNPQSLIDKLDDFEQQLLAIVDKFGNLAQAAINMYENSPSDAKIEDGYVKEEEIQNVSEMAPLDVNKETEDIANLIKTFEGTMGTVLRELPNDEPIKPNNATEFDAFLLDYTEKSILKKIKEIEILVTRRPNMQRR